jgi:G3E family GTPase
VGLFESDKYFEGAESESNHGHEQHHQHSDHPENGGFTSLSIKYFEGTGAESKQGHEQHHQHSDHLKNDGFTSLSIQSDRPLKMRKFQYFLDNQLPENVFRAKGILWFEESPKRHIFHLCGKRFSFEDEEWKGVKNNKLVLIGQNLDHDKLREQIENCR